MQLDLLDPFFYHIVLTVVISPFLEILRVVKDSHSLYSIVKKGFNIEAIEVDYIYRDKL